MENGEPPMEAALKGSREIGFTIISMTLSLSAVFIPVLFMSGLLGRLLHEFAVTIVVAVLVSGFVSLTLTPMMCSRFVHAVHGQKHGWLYSVFERFFDEVRNKYDRTLQTAMRHRRATVYRIVRDLRRDAVFVFRHPEGIFPRRRHRPDFRHHRGVAGHFLRRDARAPDGRGQNRRRRYERGRLHVGHRRRRFVRQPEQRPHFHAFKAGLGAQIERESDHPGAAAEIRANPGLERLHAKPAASSGSAAC